MFPSPTATRRRGRRSAAHLGRRILRWLVLRQSLVLQHVHQRRLPRVVESLRRTPAQRSVSFTPGRRAGAAAARRRRAAARSRSRRARNACASHQEQDFGILLPQAQRREHVVHPARAAARRRRERRSPRRRRACRRPAGPRRAREATLGLPERRAAGGVPVEQERHGCACSPHGHSRVPGPDDAPRRARARVLHRTAQPVVPMTSPQRSARPLPARVVSACALRGEALRAAALDAKGPLCRSTCRLRQRCCASCSCGTASLTITWRA